MRENAGLIRRFPLDLNTDDRMLQKWPFVEVARLG